MGRVFIEQAMVTSGINRTDMVGVLAHLVRTKRANSAGDAIRKLEAGEFDHLDIEEEMIRSLQTELPEEIVEEDTEGDK